MTTSTPIRWKELGARERDALLATELFGFPVAWSTPPYAHDPRTGLHPFLKGFSDGVHYDWAECPNYSTDLSAAFQVVEKMREKGWSYQLRDHVSGPNIRHVAFFTKNGHGFFRTENESLPECICECAIRAVGVPIEREGE
jgi:hypothetical protein